MAQDTVIALSVMAAMVIGFVSYIKRQDAKHAADLAASKAAVDAAWAADYHNPASANYDAARVAAEAAAPAPEEN